MVVLNLLNYLKRIFFSNTKNISEYLNINESDRTITTLPMHYTYGLSILNTHLFKGASIVLTNSSIIKKTLEYIL